MKPNGPTWRHARAKLDLSVDEAAAALDIQPGSLRNIETEQPRAMVSERLAYRAERLYEVPFRQLVNSSEGRPDEPPKQPKKDVAPPKRQEKSTGPKRATDSGVAA